MYNRSTYFVMPNSQTQQKIIFHADNCGFSSGRIGFNDDRSLKQVTHILNTCLNALRCTPFPMSIVYLHSPCNEKAVKYMCATPKYVLPQAFDTLVMAALACNEACNKQHKRSKCLYLHVLWKVVQKHHPHQ